MANKKTNARTSKTNTKEPLYRKWWCWVILLVVLLIACVFGWMAYKKSNLITFNTNVGTITTDGVADNVMGEAVEFENGTLTVTDVDFDWKTDSKFDQPDEGKKYVRVGVRIDNTSNAPYSSNAFYWSVLDPNGNVAGVAPVQYSEDDAILSDEIAPGESETGYVYFLVPEEDNELVMFYVPKVGSENVLSIQLQQ